MDFVLHAEGEPGQGERGGVEVALTEICEDARTSCLLKNAAACEDGECSEFLTVLIFPFFALVMGTFLKPVARVANLPYTLLLLIAGVLLGCLGCVADLGLLGTSLRQFVHLEPPNSFFYIFLAPLIFEAAYNTEWHTFRRLILPIIVAAFVIVGAQIGLIAGFQMGVIKSPEWRWTDALMFGAMLSATDPISVTATLKSLGASANLGTLIEGESLLNDGTAFVLWEGFFEAAKEGETAAPGGIIWGILKSSIFGALLGMTFGFVALGILTVVYDEFEVETSLTLIVAFLGFWTAQAPAKLSGVICNVSSGLVISALGRPLITPAVRHPLNEFWELVSWVANTIVFVHAGVMVLAFAWSCAGSPHGVKDYLFIFVHFIYLQVIRFGLFALFHPLIAWKNPWYTWKEATIVSFAGLRGAVSLVLALEVAGADHIDGNVRSRIVLWTTGLVFLSLVVNGGLTGMVLHLLGLDKVTDTKQEFLKRARSLMVQTTFGTLDILCVDIAYKSARWSYVMENTLPAAWLEKEGHGHYYAQAAESVIDNSRAHRQSLDMVYADHGGIGAQYHGYGGGRHSVAEDAEVDFEEPRRMSLSRAPKRPQAPFGGESNIRTSLVLAASPHARAGPVAHHHGSTRASLDHTGRHRRSVDYDRHLAFCKCQADPSRIHQDLVSLQARQAGDDYDVDVEQSHEDEVYREVQRRLLVAVLSHIRALANSSFVEVSALISLEQDVQRALDANEENRDYDLFSKLDHRSWYTKLVAQCVTSERLASETIVFASIVFNILTEILKQDMLAESPRVLRDAEQLYEGSAFVLNRLELLSPSEYSWVQSQFAIHVTAAKQDGALNDMLSSGQIDSHEHAFLKEELVEVRRRHSLRSRRNWNKMENARKLLSYHPLFLDPYFDKRSLAMLNLTNLHPGEKIRVEPGALVLVLQGAIRPLEDNLLPVASSTNIAAGNWDGVGRSTVNSGSVPDAQKGAMAGGEGTNQHWCFPAFSGFCGPSLAISINNHASGELAVSEIYRPHTQFIACDVSAETTVFSMPVSGVKEAARHSRSFREELSRAFAREMVLESVADQGTYDLSQVHEGLSNSVDEHSVIGRAFRVLERLPYMSVIRLHAGERAGDSGQSDGEEMTRQQILRGPGVLINGSVRVSIVDTSGLIGAANLLHERLVGPALLPSGDLIIEEAHDSNDEDNDGRMGRVRSNMNTAASRMYASAAKNVLEQEKEPEGSGSGGESADALGPILAHVLVEAHVHLPLGVEMIAKKRLERWTAHQRTVDMNGRFGMFRHLVNHGNTASRYPPNKGS